MRGPLLSFHVCLMDTAINKEEGSWEHGDPPLSSVEQDLGPELHFGEKLLETRALSSPGY